MAVDDKSIERRFVAHLQRLNPEVTREADTKALAVLRKSLAFEPTAYPRAFPYVEIFVDRENVSDWRRAMYYLVAGLYANHGATSDTAGDLGRSLARLAARREGSSLEARFLALLESEEPEALRYFLRQLTSLLKAEAVSVDYALLLKDLNRWTHPAMFVQSRWARNFYGALDKSAVDLGENEEEK